MGRIISVTLFVSFIWGEGGGDRIRIFCSAWLGNFRSVFVISRYPAIKKGGGGGGGSQRSANSSSKRLFGTSYFDHFLSNASTVANGTIFLS